MNKGLCVLWLALSAACAATKSRARDYYPWSIGTTWVYRASFLGKQETRTIVLGPMRDGFYTDDSGGRFMYDGEGLRDERRYLIREPIRAGRRWQSIAALGAAEDYEIIRAHEPCQTKAGTWQDCVEVRSTMPAADNRTLENTMVFAKGVGLVRVATLIRQGQERVPQVEMELIEFRLR